MAEFFDIMPSASKYAGKILTDHRTGQKFKSDGQKWVPLQPPAEGDFLGRLGEEMMGGAKQFGGGVRALAELQRSGQPSALTGLVDVPVGAIRMIPPIAAGTVTGKIAGEGLVDVLGPKVPANIAAGAGVAADMLTQSLIGARTGQLARAGGALTRGMAKTLPGAGAALREAGSEVVRRVPAAIRPSQPSKDLFAIVEQMDPKVTLPRYNQMAREISKEEEKLSEFGIAHGDIAKLAVKGVSATQIPKVPFHKKEVPFQTVRDVQRRLGEQIQSLRNSTASDATERLGATKRLYKALMEDLEQSQNQNVGPALDALRKANQAARREFVSQEVDDLIQPAINRPLEATERFNSRFADLLFKIRKERRENELFASTKDPFIVKNLDDLEKTLDELRKIPMAPPGRAVNVGSFQQARRASVGGLAGAAVSGAVGGDVQTGALLGGLAGVPIAGAISKLLESQGGRHWLLNFVRKEPGGILNPENFVMISMASRAFSMQDVRVEEP